MTDDIVHGIYSLKNIEHETVDCVAVESLRRAEHTRLGRDWSIRLV
jgi:hypothetical protein